ncbi:hypothetical protein [Streptomyces lonarensis]|uniref:Lipoprotein n=1 Tax=Streptomyces lonarensis TaxID=700599 RepID=A0A7X6D1E8_9ACTN|nr:hypothetical protein [Streptomyces lonarensis]NJQ06395.1 hypothetical protein [Streptomyces lonarensis]
MPRQRTRRTTRSAALTAGVLAATLALGACGSDDSADDDAQATETVASETETGTEDDTTSEQEETTEDDGADAGGPAAERDAEDGDDGELDRTEELPDGSAVDIYEIDFQIYRAEIIGEDGVLGTLRAEGGLDGIELNAMYVVLETDGSLHAWTGAGEQGPGTFTVDGGWEVEVTRHDDTHWEAKISGSSGAEDTITANGEDAVAHANGIYIVLTWAGVVSSYDPEAESTE